MIGSFRCRNTEKLFCRQRLKAFESIADIGRRKLVMLNQAIDLSDLSTLPATRLEALKGDRKGQHSIRINDQFRICFVWKDGNAYEVEIVDYH